VDLVILSRIFEFVGGGISIAYIILYSLLALATPLEMRTSAFYIVGAILLLARAGAMALCGALLEDYPWAVGPATVLVYALNIPLIAVSSFRALSPSLDLTPMRDAVIDSNNQQADERENNNSEDEATLEEENGILLSLIIRNFKNVLITAYKEYLGQLVFRISLLVCAVKIIGLDVQLIQPQ